MTKVNIALTYAVGLFVFYFAIKYFVADLKPVPYFIGGGIVAIIMIITVFKEER